MKKCSRRSHLQQDAIDTPESMLRSFPAIRQRTLNALYGQSSGILDKSPKGSVDTHIQNLVDRINQHESYATLSSCSGRIALYDPSCSSSQDENDENDGRIVDVDDNIIGRYSSGKGGTGGWLFVSHDPVPEDTLLPFYADDDGEGQINNDNQDHHDHHSRAISSSLTTTRSSCSFRMEPMLLHVAACNLQRGQQLLTVALQCGFRESGLIVSDKRITVAIRSYSLSLSVPLSTLCNHPLRPSQNYLKALTLDANRRLQTNLERLQALQVAIENSLFRSNSCCCQVTNVQSLPNLNLHSHATVAIKTTVSSADEDSGNTNCGGVDLLVFGGYGTGPSATDNNKVNNLNSTHCQRNDRVYCLKWSNNNKQQMSPHRWDIVNVEANTLPSAARVLRGNIHHMNDDDESMLLSFQNGHIPVDPIPDGWKACQGTTAVILEDDDSTSSLILLFGGRQGPAKPTNNLFLFDYNASSQCGCFYQPRRCIIQGGDSTNRLPSPRWGHTLTPLIDPMSPRQSSSWTPRFLLTGGRGEHITCPDPVYLLSVMVLETATGENNENKTPLYQFLWAPLVLGSDSPSAACRFHHSAVALDSNHVFVFGGLFDAQDLLEAFAIDNDQDNDDVDTMDSILLTLNYHQPNESLPRSVSVEKLLLPSDVSPRFGHASCAFPMPGQQTNAAVVNVVLSGGVLQQRGKIGSGQDNVLQRLQFFEESRGNFGHKQWKVASRPISWKPECIIDFGLLVHHSCVALCPEIFTDSIDIAFLGGGASGFAFQQCFAPSYCLKLEMIGAVDETGNGRKPQNQKSDVKPVNPHGVQSSYLNTGNAAATAVSCPVLYVEKQNAKSIKTALEELLLLNKAYRMTTARESSSVTDASCDGVYCDDMPSLIAVPVYQECIDLYLGQNEEKQSPSPWTRLVVRCGHQACPPSTGTFSRGNPTKLK